MRTGKPLSLNKSLQFRAQERTLIEEAFAGDIVGLWDPGMLRIGDTLARGPDVEFDGIPRFSPEHFVRVVLTEPFKRKQLKKGLEQLAEEGVVQVFFDRQRLEREPILGAVGELQFEVMQYRLKAEYGVDVRFERAQVQHARWVGNAELRPRPVRAPDGATCLVDVEQRPLVLFENDFRLQRALDEPPRAASSSPPCSPAAAAA